MGGVRKGQSENRAEQKGAISGCPKRSWDPISRGPLELHEAASDLAADGVAEGASRPRGPAFAKATAWQAEVGRFAVLNGSAFAQATARRAKR